MTLTPASVLPPRAEVVVVGGGIAGVAAAYHLARTGVEVLLLEAEALASGATGASVGVVQPPMRQPFHETVRFYGVEAARAAWTFAQRSASALVEAMEGAGAAGSGTVDRSEGCVVAAAGDRDELREACDALDDAGLPATWLEADEVACRSGSPAFAGGMALPGPAVVDAVAAARALADGARAAGATLVERAAVRSASRSRDGLTVELADATVRTEMVVYATHVGSRRFSEFLGDEIVPVRAQGLVTEPVEGVGEGGWATHRGMNVWRRDHEGRIHLTGWRWDSWDRSYWRARPEIDETLQADLVAWLRATFPDAGDVAVARRWSGVQGWTADQLPLAGPLPGSPRELVVGGFSGAGAAWAFGCGQVVAAIVAGTEAPEGAAMLNPRRHA